MSETKAPRTEIVVKIRRKPFVIPVADIRYFYADQKYTTIVHGDKETLCNETLELLEAEFAHLFIRTHRAFLVRRTLLGKLHRSTVSTRAMKLAGYNDEVIVSRRYYPVVRQVMIDTGIWNQCRCGR